MSTQKLILHLWVFTAILAFTITNSIHPFGNTTLIGITLLIYGFYQLLLYHINQEKK